MIKIKNLVLTVLIFTGIMYGQENNFQLSGNLAVDAQIAYEQGKKAGLLPQESFDPKSPLLGGVMSFIIPGAGQVYSKNYIWAAAFFAAEVAGITTAAIYDQKGEDQVDFFEGYANQHWDAAKYARWTINHLEQLNSNLSAGDYDGLFYDAERTRVNYNVLNELEDDIGSYYSHHLERYGHQQYYEMIGKYMQFAPGWDDFGDEYRDWDYKDESVSERFLYYSGLRAKANDYFSTAKTAVIVVVTNHVLSALHAAWATSKYNEKFEMELSLERENIGYVKTYYPQLNLRYAL